MISTQLRKHFPCSRPPDSQTGASSPVVWLFGGMVKNYLAKMHQSFLDTSLGVLLMCLRNQLCGCLITAVGVQ